MLNTIFIGLTVTFAILSVIPFDSLRHPVNPQQTMSISENGFMVAQYVDCNAIKINQLIKGEIQSVSAYYNETRKTVSIDIKTIVKK